MKLPPYRLILRLSYFSNETERLVGEYDIPAEYHNKIAKLLGYNSSNELTDSYPVTIEQVILIARQSDIQLTEAEIQGDYSWFIDAYGDY